MSLAQQSSTGSASKRRRDWPRELASEFEKQLAICTLRLGAELADINAGSADDTGERAILSLGPLLSHVAT